MLPTSPTFQREQTSSMQPLETYIQWELKSDGLPRAQVKPDMFRRFYIVAGLDTVKECWVQILREGDRMDRFLHAMEMIPWVTTSRQFFLHRIRGLLYGWLIQYPGDRRTKWEITPICYTGPVMLKIKDNRLDKDGMWQTGSLGTWIVNKEGHGITGFNEDPAGTITFDIKDILKEPDASKSKDLSQNRALKIVSAAAQGGYAVPALCCYNLEAIIASVRAAEAKRSPMIIQLFPWAVTYADGLLVHAAAEAADKASVPVAVHMDHAQSPEMVKRAADLGGFDGIMVDMSHYEKEENFAKTRELVAYCNERGIITEAEPGRIEGGEDGVGDTADFALQGLLTSPEQAEEFVGLGINWLAPAFGNVHGKYGPKGPQLDYERLKSIRKQVGDRVALVLHGASGEYFHEELFAKVLDCGIAKCNLNDAMNDHFLNVLKEKAGTAPLTTLIEEGTLAMQKAIEQHMDWMRSSGKA
ncbi:hypothetical protein LTS06_009013 [Exophiala xenobiotica]|nr:hypothetical protein LTS06_009013 [Exophiala xenobiotica]